MGDPVGSARVELVQGVRLLHPEDAVFDAMVSGWGKQQLGGRRLGVETVKARAGAVRAFWRFCGEYPWRWTPSMMDEWSHHLVVDRGLAASTVRAYQGSVRLFCDFVTSPYYQWAAECLQRFGVHPVQVCHEWNTARHLHEYEGRPERRALSRREVQDLLNYADTQVEEAMARRRKGVLAAYRDATLLKVIYGWGLRCQEVSRLDLPDFHANPKAPSLGRFGGIHVRYGKGARGSGPRRRTVASLMPWAVVALEDFVDNVRPLQRYAADRTALWLTERGGRVQPRWIESRFKQYAAAVGLPGELTPHCLRHSYVSHLIEDGADPAFVREQVGHRYASTLGVYTHVSEEYMSRMMGQALQRAFEDSSAGGAVR